MLLRHQLVLGNRLSGFVFTAILILALVGIIIASTDDDDIPTDIETWNECCHHDDCDRGRVAITDEQGDMFRVQFNNDPEFFIDKRKVYPSTNGKEYVCWLQSITDDEGEVYGRPTNENVLCVFKLYHMTKNEVF